MVDRNIISKLGLSAEQLDEQVNTMFTDEDNSYLEEVLKNNYIEVTSTSVNDLLDPKFELHNYPNPFNPSTTIFFNLTTEHTELIIFNLKGQEIKTFPVILSGVEGSGENYSVTWNGKDENENSVSSGVYFYKMNNGSYSHTKKMILLK